MPRYLLVLFALLSLTLPSEAFAQTARAEALLRAYEQRPEAATANAFLSQINKEGIIETQKRFTSATHPDSVKKMVWYGAAELYIAAERFDTAVVYGEKALPLFRGGTSRIEEADCESLLATACFRLGRFPEALTHARRLVEIDRASGDPDNISSSLNTLAAIYMAAGQPEEGYKHIRQALTEAARVDNLPRRAIIHGSAAEIAHRLGHDEEAVGYAREALRIERTLGNEKKVAVRLAQLAPPLIALGRNAEAKRALAEAIPRLRADSNLHSLAIACNQMGDLFLKEKNRAEAAAYYNEALTILLRQHDIYNEAHSRKGLYEALRESDPAAAMRHNDRYNSLRDSLYDKETGRLLSQYAAQYGNEQLQQENADLQRANRLRLIAVLVAVCILGLLTWRLGQRRLRKQRARNEELTRQIAQLSAPARDESVPAPPAQAHHNTTADTDDFLRRVIEAVEATLPSRTPDVESVAAALGITPVTLRRRMLACTGETPKAYISAVLMQRAASLLTQNPDLTVADVARRCGFDDASNFVRTFKRVYGITPRQFARSKAHPDEG